MTTQDDAERRLALALARADYDLAIRQQTIAEAAVQKAQALADERMDEVIAARERLRDLGVEA